MYYIYISDCMSSCFASVPHLNSQGSSSFLFLFLMELGDEFWLEVNLYFGTRFFRPIAIVYGYLFFFVVFFIAIAVVFFCFYLRCSILYLKQIANSIGFIWKNT